MNQQRHHAMPWENVPGVHTFGADEAAHASIPELLASAGLDFEVGVVPLAGLSADGQPAFGCDAKRGILNKATGMVIGAVGPRYTPVQNAAAFGFLDEIRANGYNRGVRVIAGGAFNGGARVWLLGELTNPDGTPDLIRVRGNDEIGKHVLFVNHHDGSGAVRLALTPIRFTCANTLNLALRRANERFSLSHTANVERRLHQANRMIAGAMGYFEELGRVAQELAEQRFTAAEMRAFADQLIAETRIAIDVSTRSVEDAEKAKARRDKAALELTELFRDGAGNAGQTKWDALQAVTEYVDHRRTRARDSLRRLNQIWNGAARVPKERALALLRNRR